jgi:hypothetical protein
MPALGFNQNMLSRGLVDCREFHMPSISVLLVLPDDRKSGAQTGGFNEEFM